MKVSRPGEFGLIRLFTKMTADAGVNRLGPERPVIGIGDDTAAWRADGSIELFTVDTLVQDVHFSLETMPWPEIGWKSLAINLSDIAAMGGTPEYALVAMTLPEDTEVADVTALYEGLIRLAKESRTAIIGGNISRAPLVSVTVTVIGRSADRDILRRNTARPGDVIAVTGYPGSAAAGLEMLAKKLRFKPEAMKYLKSAFFHPVPRLAEGQLLAKHDIKTAIDISDGLLADLRHICEASRVGARIDIGRVPIHPHIRDNFGDKARELTLSGGEDYELLFTCEDAAVRRVMAEMKYPVSVIGEITGRESGKTALRDASGKVIKLTKTGWRHF